MSDRTAELVEQAMEKYGSAEEAWEATKERHGTVDWNPENMPDIAELMDDSDEIPHDDTPECHYAVEFESRHFTNTVEVWCPEVDETKVIQGKRYVRHCPMCGGSIDVVTNRSGVPDDDR